MRGLSGAIGTPEAVGRMKASALRAIELDDNSAEAHSALGLYLQVHERRADAAEREFQRSIELDPSYTQARHHYGNLLSALGRLEEAVAQKRAAVELDPLAPTLSETLAFTLLRAGRPDEALHYVSDALELDSTFWRAHAVLGLFHEVNDRFDDAIREYERANELAGSRVHRTKADIARVLALAGRRDAANRLVAELQAEAAATGIHEPSVATALMATGDEDAAFAWLEMAVQQKHLHLTFIAGDARFASFDNDPRFIALLRRLSLRR
jgi:tetratricopeptide (TPR) repeat protein